MIDCLRALHARAAIRFKRMWFQVGVRWLWIQREASAPFPFGGVHHRYSIPGATFQEGAVGAFAGAELAADAQIRIDFDTAVRVVILIRDPEHARIDGTVLDAGRRARASGAVVHYDREDLRFFLPEVGPPVRHGLHLHER